jgi:predicted CxxxxCH...CXXCH cytochrome family protein
MSTQSSRGALLLAALFAAGCLVPRNEDNGQTADNRCTSCHGSPDNQGDVVARAAPPFDTKGNTDTASPGVGAHRYHLNASGTHAAVACEECHVVPKRVSDPGHDDHGGAATITFGTLATKTDGGPAPTYDAENHSCANTYCHGAAVKPAVWTAPRGSTEACGSCHALPPPAPHPASTECSMCHDKVVDATRTIIDPSLHVNGTVDVRALTCGSCHGQGDGGAPPRSLDGGTTPDNPGVGAHTAHLRGNNFSRDTLCTDCHKVPTEVGSPGHANGTVDVVLSGLPTVGRRDAGATFDATTLTCNAWCHTPEGGAATSPKWTRTGAAPLGCDGCHGAPPAAPHPQVARCSVCHNNALPDGGFVDRSLHVNGVIEVIQATGCTACHGSGMDPAPPKDTSGNTATTAVGVGAHQKHLTTTITRPLACPDCHRVPTELSSPGHLNGTVEVQLTGTAAAFNAAATYNPANHTCNTYCHNMSQVLGTSAGGTTPMPVWNQVDGVQANCSGCHGFPPPPPPMGRHPARTDCGSCHPNVAVDGGSVTWVRPELHVDSHITFALP